MKYTVALRRTLIGMGVLLTVSALASCEVLESLLGFSFGNSAPTVTLSASVSSAYSDQTITFTATASDDDDDDLTYEWYWNGAIVSSATESSVNWYWLTSTNATQVVRVVVSDGEDESSAEVSVTIQAGASLRIDNYDSVGYDEIYVSSSYTSWGSDIYSSVLSPGYRVTVYNLGTGYLYYKAVDVNNYYWDTYTNLSSGYSTSLGYYRIFKLYSSSCSVSAASNVASSVIDGEDQAVSAKTPSI